MNFKFLTSLLAENNGLYSLAILLVFLNIDIRHFLVRFLVRALLVAAEPRSIFIAVLAILKIGDIQLLYFQ